MSYDPICPSCGGCEYDCYYGNPKQPHCKTTSKTQSKMTHQNSNKRRKKVLKHAKTNVVFANGTIEEGKVENVEDAIAKLNSFFSSDFHKNKFLKPS